MNVTSGGPHILLFERDQQLTALLSGELGLAGYEVHTSRTAVEVFDAIARFPVRLVMVNLAQAQAGRREFWVALDAQRRGRGVQVFTFRCSNLGGYGPDDPEEHVQTVATDLEVDGMLGIVKLVDAVRMRVPGSTVTGSPARFLPPPALHGNEMSRQGEMSPTRSGLPPFQPVQPLPPPGPMPMSINAAVPLGAPSVQINQRLPVQQEMPAPVPPLRQAEPPRSGPSTFTDKIRAVIYPSSRNFSSVPETNWSPHSAAPLNQNATQYQNPDVQPRPQASQRFAEADYPSTMNREEMTFHSTINNQASGQSTMNNQASSQSTYGARNGTSLGATSRSLNEESGLDQLSRLLRESQPAPNMNGNAQNASNAQNAAAYPTITVDQQELQEFRAQLQQAARMDEAYGRTTSNQQKPPEVPGANGQLRASPIHDMPFEREIENRRGGGNGAFAQSSEHFNPPALAILQPTQAIPPVPPAQSQPGSQQAPVAENRVISSGSNSAARPLPPIREASPETPIAGMMGSQARPVQEIASQSGLQEVQVSGTLSLSEDDVLAAQVRANFQQTLSRRPEVRTSDDTLLDIVKSLPPMAPVPQPPQVQVLSGRATRSLGSVLLEGHLVPQERLQVAQHVQRMLRGVDLNYQLGEILLMFKLLTPDQLLAASLVSYGMISTIQITALGRIRQELHAIGLEYDLESLLVLFRILTPEQLREVRASWSS